jgi:hypothetical protein
MNLKKNCKIILMFFLATFILSKNLVAEPRPAGVEPPYDEEGNPDYQIIYGEGDRIDPSTNKPLNLIQIRCQDIAVDMATDEKMDQCREDATLVKMEYGWMDFSTYKGWRAYHAECHVCHGPDVMGSTYAPSLMESVQNGMTWDAFFEVIMNGRNESQGAAKGNVMPAFGANPNVADDVEDMYRYVKARAEGKIRRGVRLPKLPKVKEVE